MDRRISCLFRSVAVAVLFAIAYLAMRHVSLAANSALNWAPVMGLRFSCLLLLPRKYWPALFVGDAGALAYANYLCLDQFGWPWVIVTSIPPTLLMAPVLYGLRHRLPGLERPVAAHMGMLVGSSVMVTLVLVGRGWIGYSLEKTLPVGETFSYQDFGSKILIGNFLGILAFTPFGLWLVRGARRVAAQGPITVQRIAAYLRKQSSLEIAACLAVVGAMALAGQHARAQAHAMLLLGLFVVLFLASWRHGWQGTAIVGAAINLVIAAIMPIPNDFTTLYAQGIMGSAMAGLLMLGAAITVTQQKSREIIALQLKLARQELFLAERGRIRGSYLVEEIMKSTSMEVMRLLQKARGHVPSKDIATHYEQFQTLQRQLDRVTVGMFPQVWWYFGGPDGPLVEALGELGVRGEIGGDRYDSRIVQLPAQIQIALYRLSCEAVIYLMHTAPSDHLRLAMRMGQQADEGYVEAVLESIGQPRTFASHERERLIITLGAFGLSEQAMRHRAMLYHGHFEVTVSTGAGMRIAIRLADKIPA